MPSFTGCDTCEFASSVVDFTTKPDICFDRLPTYTTCCGVGGFSDSHGSELLGTGRRSPVSHGDLASTFNHLSKLDCGTWVLNANGFSSSAACASLVVSRLSGCVASAAGFPTSDESSHLFMLLFATSSTEHIASVSLSRTSVNTRLAGFRSAVSQSGLSSPRRR
ncbi:hypothetical protein NP493_3258g00004 [Ridgeia piscesae]|uniref:Uncharacterized protein n=1 Tax=Ridgeia piscesae TaxID=27915 RepID=A0AAD9J969_RIDPI|nr:hypothetical protein NP493_3258g00004 [Ridgeia piscesae]